MIKIFYTVILFNFLSTSVFSQKIQFAKYAFSQKIDKNYSLVYLKFNKSFNLYSNPRVLWQNKLMKIKDFDENNFTDMTINISPNKKYLVMSNIIKGYVQTEKDSVLHENYTCVIIDIKSAKIIRRFQADCGGSWNKDNEWKNEDKVLFKGISAKARKKL